MLNLKLNMFGIFFNLVLMLFYNIYNCDIIIIATVVISLGLAQDSWAESRGLDCPSVNTFISISVTELDVDFLLESWEECGRSVVTVVTYSFDIITLPRNPFTTCKTSFRCTLQHNKWLPILDMV